MIRQSITMYHAMVTWDISNIQNGLSEGRYLSHEYVRYIFHAYIHGGICCRNGTITLPFRLLSEYESGVLFRNCPNVPPNVFSLMFHRMLPVCFPNVFSMVSEYFQNRANTSLMFISKGFLSERFLFAFRMLSEHDEST